MAYCVHVAVDRLASCGQNGSAPSVGSALPGPTGPGSGGPQDPVFGHSGQENGAAERASAERALVRRGAPKRTGYGEIRLQIRPEVRRLLEERRSSHDRPATGHSSTLNRAERSSAIPDGPPQCLLQTAQGHFSGRV
jgi:hypothetical protein